MKVKKKNIVKTGVFGGVMAIIAVLGVVAWILFDGGARWKGGVEEIFELPATDSIFETSLCQRERMLPDTVYESIHNLIYQIDVFDTVASPLLSSFENRYAGIEGILTFRGSPARNAPFVGKILGKPSKIVVDWVFRTAFDTVKTAYGVWGGGSGWTGQPLYISWPDSLQQSFAERSPGLTPAFSNEEVIVGSLAGYIYFIDYQTGKASREAINVHNPVKGTPSLDPSLNGNLYIGHGVPREKPFGMVVLNLFSHQQTQMIPEDRNAWRGWGAYDSSPVAVGDFLLCYGENGTVYKYLVEESTLNIHSTLRYKVKGKNAAGIESSPAIYKNYAYLTDNHGNIICVNINTLQPVWHYDNQDDTDGSPVVEEEDGVPFVYVGSEIDRQGMEGFSYFVKLNGLTGEKIWEQKIGGKRWDRGNDFSDGGMFSTPLVGMMDCDSLIFSNFCIHIPVLKGEFIAMNRYNGNIVYRIPLKRYAWSSPVAFCNDEGEMFVFTADTNGNVYLIQGKTGEIVLNSKVGNNFESSPIVINNSVVFGSRGREIYKLTIE